jgi:hypothetical protein
MVSVLSTSKKILFVIVANFRSEYVLVFMLVLDFINIHHFITELKAFNSVSVNILFKLGSIFNALL